MMDEIENQRDQEEQKNPIQILSQDLSSPLDKEHSKTIENAPAPGEEAAP